MFFILLLNVNSSKNVLFWQIFWLSKHPQINVGRKKKTLSGETSLTHFYQGNRASMTVEYGWQMNGLKNKKYRLVTLRVGVRLSVLPLEFYSASKSYCVILTQWLQTKSALSLASILLRLNVAKISSAPLPGMTLGWGSCASLRFSFAWYVIWNIENRVFKACYSR